MKVKNWKDLYDMFWKKRETKKKIEAVLFDLDGVLINSFECWYQVFNKMLRVYGRQEIEREEFRVKYWGINFEYIIDEEEAKYCVDEQLQMIDFIELFPDVKEVLFNVKEKYKIGLVTNTPKKNVNKILKHFHLSDCFNVIVAGDEVKKGKPDAEMVVKACAELGVEPGNAIIVGDTENDFVAGKSAGCTVVGLGIGLRCDIRIGSLLELFKTI